MHSSIIKDENSVKHVKKYDQVLTIHYISSTINKTNKPSVNYDVDAFLKTNTSVLVGS